MDVQPLGVYDPFWHTITDDPYPVYQLLRDEHPIYRSEERDCWVASRFDDIVRISRDVTTFSCAAGVDLDLPATYLGPGDFLATDPPMHTRLRQILHQSFTPKAIARLETGVRARVRPMVTNISAGDPIDLSASLAMPLPMHTILDLMGLPDDDRTQVRDWLHATTLRIPGSPDRPPECDAAHEALADYLGDVLEQRRREPQDDLITVMAQAVDTGRMSLAETHGMLLLLIVAGWVTTACLVSNAVWLLAQHPDQFQILAHDPNAIPDGVEEVLRLESPVQYLMRTTTTEVELHGVPIPSGSKILLLYAAGNRDGRRWEDPDRFDVRRRLWRHLAFGDGIHHCLGAPLSRLSGRIVLEELLAHWGRIELAGPTTRLDSVVLRGFEQLPVRLFAA